MPDFKNNDQNIADLSPIKIISSIRKNKFTKKLKFRNQFDDLVISDFKLIAIIANPNALINKADFNSIQSSYYISLKKNESLNNFIPSFISNISFNMELSRFKIVSNISNHFNSFRSEKKDAPNINKVKKNFLQRVLNNNNIQINKNVSNKKIIKINGLVFTIELKENMAINDKSCVNCHLSVEKCFGCLMSEINFSITKDCQ